MDPRIKVHPQMTVKTFLDNNQEIITDAMVAVHPFLTATGKDIINNKFKFEFGKNKQLYYDYDEDDTLTDVADKIHVMANYILTKNTPEYTSLNSMLNHQFDYDKNYQETIRHIGQITDDFTADNDKSRTDNLQDQTTYNESKDLTHGHTITDTKTGTETLAKSGSETDTQTFTDRASTTEYGAENSPRTTTQSGTNTAEVQTKPFDANGSYVGASKTVENPAQVSTEAGKEKTTESGQEANVHTYTSRQDQTTHNTTDTATHSGKDTEEHTGTKTDAHTGTQTENEIKDEFNDRNIDETTTKSVTGLDIIDQYNKIREFYKQNLWDKIVRDLLDVLTYRTYVTSYWDL